MLFPTTVFAVFFLVVITGSLLLKRHRRLWMSFMLAASYVFYGWWNWRFLGLILFCSVTNHIAALLLARDQTTAAMRRVVLTLAVVLNLGVLGFFKYYGFFIMSVYAFCSSVGLRCNLPILEIVLPVGISFFTFQAMSYVIDVYRGEIPPAPDLLSFATYLAFFPQLVAGPIVRASVFLPQLKKPEVRQQDIGQAATLILVGLFKKVVLANLLARLVVDPVFAYPESYGAVDILLGIYGYAAQIYCDFSAYSDIAIGTALLLGIRFPVNFNVPYGAASFQEFWRRWHISLSTWLRDYLYIPLGGSHHGAWKTYRNLFLTFLLGGLWHGANWRFVAWGLLHGMYLMVERMLRFRTPRRVPSGKLTMALRKFAGILIVFHGVCLSWVFFRSDTFSDAWLMLRHLGLWQTPATLLKGPVVLLLILSFSIQLMDGERAKALWFRFNRMPFWLQGLLAALILTVILALGPQGVSPFIYFQF